MYVAFPRGIDNKTRCTPSSDLPNIVAWACYRNVSESPVFAVRNVRGDWLFVQKELGWFDLTQHTVLDLHAFCKFRLFTCL